MNFFEKMTNLILAFQTRLAAETNSVTIDEFESFIFKFGKQKTNMNDNLTKFNLRFKGSKLLRTKLN